MPLETELEAFKTKAAHMKEHEGKFALVKGENVVDFFSTYEDAIKAGYQQFGLEPFLVKQIRTVPGQALSISRLFDPLAGATT